MGAEPTVEKPLMGMVRVGLVASATAVIVLFYLYCLLSLLVVGGLLVLEVAAAVALARFGLSQYMVEPIRAQGRLAFLILRSLNLKRGVEYHLPLCREEAPGLYGKVEQVACRVGINPPDEIRLEMGNTAWVQLRGYRKARGRCTLGLGYDLLATLSVSELEAVIAHEMAHAKLIQRGYKGWLSKGILRISQLASALQGVEASFREAGKTFHTVAWIFKGTHLLARTGSRLVAAYSRQDEFAADRVAAEICGSQACRGALLRIHGVDWKAAALTWHERLVQSQRDASFSGWLRGRLLPQSDAEAGELEQQVLASAQRSEWDTHPALRDRLAALPEVFSPVEDNTPALHLLEAPDATAQRLIAELERLANEQERQETERLRRWFRKEQTGYGRRRNDRQVLAVVLVGVGLILWALGIGFTTDPTLSSRYLLSAFFAAGFVGLGGGVLLYRSCQRLHGIPLPVPSLSCWQEALSVETRTPTEAAWQQLEMDLRVLLPPEIKGRKARARFWAERCYEALQGCDYPRAWIASRLCLEAHPRCLEGVLGYGVTAAYFGQTEAAQQALEWALNEYGPGTSVSWALGWTFILLGNWGAAEAYLLDSTARRSQEATLWSLLGLSQCWQGKLREALQNFRQALTLEPQEPRHRIWLTKALLASGRPRQALREWEILIQRAPSDFEVMLIGARSHLLLGRMEEATHQVELIEQAHPGAPTLLEIAHAYQEASLPEQARSYLERVCQEGFYPEALLGLAQIAYNARDYDQARTYLRSALDVTRELGPRARSPLELLGPICQGLVALNEPVAGCSPRLAHLDLSSCSLGVDRLSLLVLAPTLESAEGCVHGLLEAMFPGKTWSATAVTWEPAPSETQPEGPVAPGIYGHQWG